MLYELHVTVSPDTAIDRWKTFCEDYGIKPLVIHLEGEEPMYAPIQVMSADTFSGTDFEADAWFAQTLYDVTINGFDIIRTKLEVPLDKSAGYEPEYHEAHIKSLIPCEEVDKIVVEATNRGWVASKNALFEVFDGLEKWYFTQRAYSTPYIEAGRTFAELYSDLATYNWHTVRMEMETVIKDSNPRLDEGWA